MATATQSKKKSYSPFIAAKVAALIKELKAARPELQGDVAERLWQYCGENHSAKDAVRDLGGILLLVDLVKDGPDDPEKSVKACGAQALTRLGGKNDENKQAIAKAGGIVVLVDVLSDVPRRTTGIAKREAAGALWTVAKNANNKVSIAAVDGIGAIIDLAARTRDTVTMMYCGGALRNLSCNNDENKAQIVKLGGVATLVSVVKNSDDDRSREEAAAALGNIARMENDENRIFVAAAGAIPPLAACLDSPCDSCRAAAAGALAILACHNENARQVAVYGGVPALSRLLRATEAGQKAREEAAVALRNLTCRARKLCRGRLDEDLARSIVDLVGVVENASENSDRARASAAVAISNLISDDTNVVTLIQAAGVPPLVHFAGESLPSDALYEAVTTLRNLSHHAVAWAPMRLAGAVPILVFRLLSRDALIVDHATCALANLLNDLGTHLALRDAQGVGPLVRIARGTTDAALDATRALHLVISAGLCDNPILADVADLDFLSDDDFDIDIR